MIRFVLPIALSVSFALPLAAQSKKDQFCDELAYASQQIADLRISGSSEADAQSAIAGQYEENQVNHLQMIPYLSSFVYGLNKTQLKGDVETSFADQCKAFDG